MPDCTTRFHGTSHTRTSLTARTRGHCEFIMLQISNCMIACLPKSYCLSVCTHAYRQTDTHAHTNMHIPSSTLAYIRLMKRQIHISSAHTNHAYICHKRCSSLKEDANNEDIKADSKCDIKHG